MTALRPLRLHAGRIIETGYRVPLCGAFDAVYYAPTPEAVTCASCRRIQESR